MAGPVLDWIIFLAYFEIFQTTKNSEKLVNLGPNILGIVWCLKPLMRNVPTWSDTL